MFHGLLILHWKVKIQFCFLFNCELLRRVIFSAETWPVGANLALLIPSFIGPGGNGVRHTGCLQFVRTFSVAKCVTSFHNSALLVAEFYQAVVLLVRLFHPSLLAAHLVFGFRKSLLTFATYDYGCLDFPSKHTIHCISIKCILLSL